MELRLADITEYIVPDAEMGIRSRLSAYDKDSVLINIAGVKIFAGGAKVITRLEEDGYVLMDSEDRHRDRLLFTNRSLSQNYSLVVHENLFEDADGLVDHIESLSTDTEVIYQCSDPEIYPVALLSLLFRPEVKWTFPNTLHDFGRYVMKNLYVNGDRKSLRAFIEIATAKRDLIYFYRDDMIEFRVEAPESDKDIIYINEIDAQFTWLEAFESKAILPAEFGRKCLIDSELWDGVARAAVRDSLIRKKPKQPIEDILTRGRLK